MLVLGGAAEARAVARGVGALRGWRVTVSLAQADRLAGEFSVVPRLGGFGGASGFQDFLRTQQINAVLDATHPFAAQISARTARICAAMGLPHAQVLRSGWSSAPGDNWQFVPDEAAACALVHRSERVFATTGRATLRGYRDFPGARLFLRRLGAVTPVPFDFVELVPGQGPFTVSEEQETFCALNIDRLIVKNSGGTTSRTKLDAARALGLPVVLIERPKPAAELVLKDVSAALKWVESL